MASAMTMLNHLQITFEDIVKATNNFHQDNIIERGEFDTTYKGQLPRSGRLVKIAARRFDCKHGEGDLKFLTEILVLSDLKHRNIISIIGFYNERDEKIIVTKYEANGSLGQYLNIPNLTWTQRLKICVGVARALSYLHYYKGREYDIIHCNINSDTILLDENWEAKLSGFEISIKQLLGYKNQACFCEHIGTTGCMDPAIKKTGGVTHNSDIYSFGIVLFEIFCGRKAFIENETNRFLPMVKYHYENNTLLDIIHPNLVMSPQFLLKYLDLAYSCLNEDPAHRPKMKCIVAKLEEALQLQQRYENIGKNLEHLKIRLTDINLATDKFLKAYKLSSCRYIIYYRAKLNYYATQNPSHVVIRRVYSGQGMYREEDFLTEIEVLTRVKHPNIVTLFGFCIEAYEMILVLEDFSNGLLDDHLRNNKKRGVWTWEQRLKICIDVACALKCLHSEMIIHRDICSYSIGLDENWGAKIVSFHKCVSLPTNHEDKALYLKWVGKAPYIDPEYKETNKLKKESDVYSFGVVLFEILCGRGANDPIYKMESDKGLAVVARRSYRAGTLEEMVDPIIREEAGEGNFVLNKGPNKNSLHVFIKIAYECVAETQDQRPTMKVVVKELERALFLQISKGEGAQPNKVQHIKSKKKNKESLRGRRR